MTLWDRLLACLFFIYADWIIDLVPEGGDRGGKIVAMGTPENLIIVFPTDNLKSGTIITSKKQ